MQARVAFQRSPGIPAVKIRRHPKLPIPVSYVDGTRVTAYMTSADESQFDAIAAEASCGPVGGCSHPTTAPISPATKIKKFPGSNSGSTGRSRSLFSLVKARRGCCEAADALCDVRFFGQFCAPFLTLIPGAFRRLVPTWYASLLSGPHCAAGQVWRRQGRRQSGAPRVMAVHQRPYGRNPIRPCAKSAIKRGADCYRYMERWCTAHSGFETRRRGSESPAIQTHMPVSSLVERSASRPLQVRYLP